MTIASYRDYRRSLGRLAEIIENDPEYESKIEASELVHQIARYMVDGGDLGTGSGDRERIRDGEDDV